MNLRFHINILIYYLHYFLNRYVASFLNFVATDDLILYPREIIISKL